jgi:hypothetical protein
MFPPDPYLHLLVWKEQYQDRQREAERERLIRITGGQASRPWRVHPHRTVASWMGEQLMRWGQKLQNYGGVDWSQLAGSHLGSGVAGVNAPEE